MENNVKQAALDEVKWQAIEEGVAQVNPELAKIINGIISGASKQLRQHLRLYKARYPFGSPIIKNGIFYCPTPHGIIAPLADACLSTQVYEDLNYVHTRFPAGIILNHSAEWFMVSAQKMMPFALMRSGSLFGLDSIVGDPSPVNKAWQMVAGARHIFMLPKITDKVCYKRLSRFYHLKDPLPWDLLNQHALFAQMAQSPYFPAPWHTELLFFSAAWLKKYDSEYWLRFRCFLGETALKTAPFGHAQLMINVMWDSFIRHLDKTNHYPIKAPIVDIVKQLLMVALGVAIGFAPALDEECAPINQLQADFTHIYALKNFAPVIMAPRYFNLEDKNARPVYWSLQLPAYFNSVPKPKKESSLMEVLRDIKRLLDLFIKAAQNHKISGLRGSLMEKCIATVQFDYFHSDSDLEGHIRLTTDIPREDSAFTAYQGRKQQFFPVSPFLRGCVRIAHKKSDA